MTDGNIVRIKMRNFRGSKQFRDFASQCKEVSTSDLIEWMRDAIHGPGRFRLQFSSSSVLMFQGVA